MKKIASYLTNFIAPSAGFSEGQLKDDPGDGSGSGTTVQTGNDWLYACYALIKKYIGVSSDTDESETASDVMDSVETMAGVKNPNVSEYSNVTAYVADDHVMYLGIQFVAMVSTTGNEPFSNPDKWLPCFNRDDAFVKWQKGDDIAGGFDVLHDYRDAAYRQVFSWGQYNVGGDAGKNFEAFGIHLDGTQITLDATLEAIFDVGGGGEYHLLDIIAPDVVGTRTLMDSRGRVAACIDAGGGNRAIVGDVQEDAFQGHLHAITVDNDAHNHVADIRGTATIDGAASRVGTETGAGAKTDSTTIDINSDSHNHVGSASSPIADLDGTPRTGLETQMKNFSVGVTSVLVINELP